MFLETICIDHGKVLNMEAHRERMEQTASRFGFNTPTLPNLLSLLPEELYTAKIKCRIIYNNNVQEITFNMYRPKTVHSLKLVEATPDYAFKYADRKELTTLLEGKDNADEILICRNGLITDTTFTNVVFRQGDQLFTPDSWLLNGTKRQKLLREGTITAQRITRDTLHRYDSLYLINAMLDIDEAASIPINHIYL